MADTRSVRELKRQILAEVQAQEKYWEEYWGNEALNSRLEKRAQGIVGRDLFNGRMHSRLYFSGGHTSPRMVTFTIPQSDFNKLAPALRELRDARQAAA